MNYAELQTEIDTDPRHSVLTRLGSTHARYGWTKRIQGNWSNSQIEIYSKSYDSEILIICAENKGE